MKQGTKRVERDDERNTQTDIKVDAKTPVPEVGKKHKNMLHDFIRLVSETTLDGDNTSGTFLTRLAKAEWLFAADDECETDRNLLQILDMFDAQTLQAFDWNESDSDNSSSLNWLAKAAADGNAICLKALYNKLDKTAFQTLEWNKPDIGNNSPLYYVSCAAEDDPKLLEELFDKLEAYAFQNLNWNLKDEDTSETPLCRVIRAAMKGHTGLMSSLLMRLHPESLKQLDFDVSRDVFEEVTSLVNDMYNSGYYGWISFAILAGCKIGKKLSHLSEEARTFVRDVKKQKYIIEQLGVAADNLLAINAVKHNLLVENQPLGIAVKNALVSASKKNYTSEIKLKKVKMLAKIAHLTGDVDAYWTLGTVYEQHKLWDRASNAFSKVPQESSMFAAAQSKRQYVSSSAANYYYSQALKAKDSDTQSLNLRQAMLYALRCDAQDKELLMEMIIGTHLSGGKTTHDDLKKIPSDLLETQEGTITVEALFAKINALKVQFRGAAVIEQNANTEWVSSMTNQRDLEQDQPKGEKSPHKSPRKSAKEESPRERKRRHYSAGN